MDIIDAALKTLQDVNEQKATKTEVENHINDKDNPHEVSKESIGLSNVVNRKQMYAINSPVTTDGIPVFDGNGCTVRDSGVNIGTVATKNYVNANIPNTEEILANATAYADKIALGKVDKVNGKVLSSNDYTNEAVTKLQSIENGAQKNTITGVKGESETAYRAGQVNITKSNLGLANVENKSSQQIRNELTKSNVTTALGYTPEIEGAYQNATAYADKKFEELTGVDSETLENINKIADEVRNNKEIMDALSTSISSKASQSELDTHTGNNTIHVTATDKSNISKALTHANSTHARTDATKTESSAINGNVKINGTETKVYTHPAGTNPHGATKSDVGLSNVPNVGTNDQTPTFTASTTLTNLTSGEKLSLSLGKISKAISSFIQHLANHVKPDNKTIKAAADGTLSTQYIKKIPIEIGTDLNDYYNPGFYTCGFNAVQGNLANRPFDSQFGMIVFPTFTNGDTVCQMIVENVVHPKICIRVMSAIGKTYGDFIRLYTIENTGDLTKLITNHKDTFVNAINELSLKSSSMKNYVSIRELGLTVDQKYTCLDVAKKMENGSSITIDTYNIISDCPESYQYGTLTITRVNEQRTFARFFKAASLADPDVALPPKTYDRFILISKNVVSEWSCNVTNNQIATADKAGIVKPDNSTIVVLADGTMKTHFTNAIAIPGGADLWNYKNPGTYFCALSATAQTLKHCPTKKAFMLTVGKHAGTYQEIVEYAPSNPKRFMRNYYYTDDVWGPDYHVYTEADPPPLTNNLLATVPGTALDAVQGAALDGKISELNRKLTVSSGTLTKGPKFTGACYYYIKNGWCFVVMELTPSNSVAHGDIVLTGLPYSVIVVYLSLTGSNTSGSVNYSAYLRNGALSIYYPQYTAVARIDCSFSYPVAE